jgi:hypothetical protein
VRLSSFQPFFHECFDSREQSLSLFPRKKTFVFCGFRCAQPKC